MTKGQSTMNILTENTSQNNNGFSRRTKGKNTHTPKYNKPHMIISLKDMDWASQQKPAIYKLWSECWRCDPYGSRWIQVNTTLKRSAFMQAKKVLESQGLFIFKPDKSIGDGRETVCWLVQNLHGSRVKSYWEESTNTDCKSTSVDIESTIMDIESTSMDSIDTQTEVQQDFQEASVTSQEHLSNSSKELLRCENSTGNAAPPKGAFSADDLDEEEKQLIEVARLRARAEVDKLKARLKAKAKI